MSFDDTQNKKQQASSSHRNIIAMCAGLLLIAAIVAWALVRNAHNPKAEAEAETAAQLDSLHVFPPVDFADSLYQASVVAAYDDDSPRDVIYYEIDSLGNTTQNKVHETHYYPDKKKYVDGNIHENQRDGIWYAYHPNGNVQTMAYYVNGKEEGQYTVYHPNGAVYYTGKYHEGKRVGTWSFYDENEKLVQTQEY